MDKCTVDGEEFRTLWRRIWKSFPPVDVCLRLLPQVQTARASIVGRYHPVGQELPLDRQAPTVHVGLVQVVLERSNVWPSLREVELFEKCVGEVDLLPAPVDNGLIDAAYQRVRREFLQRRPD